MASEAFALSPMSARAAEPNEQDYDAIRDAFMETARGRWFLGEYAKRNRNSDTRMVLDAVAKIEETLAAQRQPVVVDRLPEALLAIRQAVTDAELAAGATLDPAALAANVGPIIRGARIIKEISWRWREIGADGRICDLIDSQLTAIEAACGEISAIDPRDGLKAAFDLLRDRVNRTDGDHAEAAEATAPMRPAPAPVAVAEMPEPVVAAIEPEAMVAADEVGETMALSEAADAADAEDEAVLARIALEMAAPDPDFDELIAEPAEMAAALHEPVAAEPVHVEQAHVERVHVEAAHEPAEAEPIHSDLIAPESIAQLRAAIAEAAVAVLERPAPEVMQTPSPPMPSPLSEPSLGATILASGLLQKPRPANDPLAPIRRMTQAERIAFFS